MGEITVDGLQRRVEDRARLDDGDPELGHAEIDSVMEDVVRAVAAGHPDYQDLTRVAVGLLDLEEAARWTRWYA